MKRVLSSPVLYAVWAVFVVGALVASYFVDPYVFAFAAIGLGWATGALSLLAVLTAVASRATVSRRGAVIALFLAIAAGAILTALRVLRTFNWA
jgi:hypothetical protein